MGPSVALLGLLLLAPPGAVLAQALAKGASAYLESFADPDTRAAIRLTLLVALIAVPINTVFGICAAWAIARFEFRGKSLLITLIGLPFAVSPVIAGLVFVLLFGAQGYSGPWLTAHGVKVVFALPAMILAKLFVTFPFVARELIPLMRSVLVVAAAGAVVEDLEIRRRGARVLTIDAGIQVLTASDVTLRRVTVRDCLYGGYAERADRLRVVDCRLSGCVAPLQEDGEGNGIHPWYTRGALLEGNDVSRFLDGIYLSFADSSHVRGNRLHHCGRYGLHTMYCQANELTGNRFTRNVAGCAIMFSNRAPGSATSVQSQK